MTTEALKIFMLEQGPSKNTNLMEWDKIWAINKQVIDGVAPRYSAIGESTKCKLIIDNYEERDVKHVESHPLHPKNAALGTKPVFYGKEVFIERDDAIDI